MGSIAIIEKPTTKKELSSRLFELEEQFKLDGGVFKPARVGDLFTIRPTKHYGYTNDRLFATSGTTPVVVNSSQYNGIGGYVDLEPTEKGGIITFSDTTNSDCIFYQPNPFIGYSHVQGMYPLLDDKWTKNSLCYFIVLFRKVTQGLFDYGTKFNRKIASEFNVLLPYKNNEIAFSYMEDFISELQAERLQELQGYLRTTGLSDYTLTEENKRAMKQIEAVQWKEFNVKSLFHSATRGKRLKSADRDSGNLPFVTAGETDTGISAFIGNDVEIFPKNTITIDMFGSAKYRNYEYGADDHIAVVHTQNLPKYAVMFVTSAIHKVASAGKFSYSRNFYAKDADELNISLPVDPNGNPDYDLMNNYMEAIHKLVITDVAKFAETEENAYKTVIETR